MGHGGAWCCIVVRREKRRGKVRLQLHMTSGGGLVICEITT